MQNQKVHTWYLVVLFLAPGILFSQTWIAREGQYDLVNAAGKNILPSAEKYPLPITEVCPGVFRIERYAFGATSEQEEEQAMTDMTNRIIFRQVAYFDSLYNPLVEPFKFENRIDKNRYFCAVVIEGEHDTPDSIRQQLCYYQEVWQGGKVGLLNLHTGQMLLPPDYLYIAKSPRALFTWHSYDSTRLSMKYTLIDLPTGNKWIVPDSIRLRLYPYSSDRILAENTRTSLYGYVSPTGQTVIPFQYLEAFPFWVDQQSKVQEPDGIWYVIDMQGKKVRRLGKSHLEYEDSHGRIWSPSDEDGQYRIRQASPDLLLGHIGLNFVPDEVKRYGKTYWLARKNYKSGLLDAKGRILLPFEYDEIDFNFQKHGSDSDIMVFEKYFSVTKNGRKWLFDVKTQKPIRPKLEKGNGLQLGQPFDRGNFSLITHVSGDSLFQIQITDKVYDILNIRTGHRWNINNAQSLHMGYSGESGGPYLYVYTGGDKRERYRLNGVRVDK